MAAVEALPKPQPWGLCVRISYARDGSTLGVERQEPPTKALIERLGGFVAKTYIRNDTSAFNTKVFPFEDALDDLRNGVIVGLAAWQLDRFTRRVDHATYLQNVVRELGGRVAWGGSEVDVGKAAGRFNVNVLSAVSQFESNLKSERLQLKNGQKAKDREPHSGGYRPFGFNKDRKTHRKREVAIIQDAADRLLNDEESVYSILADWTAKGIRTTAGNRWTTTAFRRLMTSPRVAGKRQHHDTDYDNAWEPILDETTWRQVRRVFENKDARRRQGPPVKKLLVGMLRCSKCGAVLITRLGGRPGTIRSYGCPPPKYGDGCGHTNIVAEPLEAHVRERALELLDTKEVCAAIMREEPTPATGPLYAERDKLVRRRDELEDKRSDPDVPLARTDRDLAKIDSRLREIEAELQRRIPKRRPLLIPYGKTPEWVWDHGSIEVQRSLLRLVIDHIVIHPPRSSHRNRFDPDRAEIILVEELLSDRTVAAITRAVLRNR